jgi:HAD superfamily hydrolase (TIGR01450 family)
VNEDPGRRALEGIDGLVCDLDGVVYRGNRAIAGAREALAGLRAAGLPVIFCTNNSRSTVAQYVAKLASMGVDADEGSVLTSAVVTAQVLKQRGFSGTRAIVLGGPGLREELAGIGAVIDDDPDHGAADLVAVGLDLDFDYAAMRRASRAVRYGAAFVATNDDVTLPTSDGLWPGAGAILASIEVASGRRAEVMGKPHRAMMEAAWERLDGAANVAVVGDRPETDLEGAAAMGWRTILVLSGVTAPEEADAVTPRPDVVLGSLAELRIT